MVEETTTGRGYQKPHPSNQLSEDVHRLRAGVDSVDADIVALLAALAGKAAVAHTHAIEGVDGLSAALSGKAPTSHSHSIGGLSDVTVTGAASGHVLKFTGAGWATAALAISDIVNLGATLTSMQDAIATMDDGTF